MENLEIGKLHTLEQHRDAVHMAIAPAVAGERMSPGKRIKIVDGKAVDAKGSKDSIGIVDPFLPGFVSEGDKFWIFLYPGTITSLRHEWTHPFFTQEPPPITEEDREQAAKVAARLEGTSLRWLKDYADRLNVTYEDLLSNTEEYLAHGSYWCGGEFEGESLPEGFWEHYQKVTGKKVEENKQDSFFTCAC